MIAKTEASLKAFMHVMSIWNFSKSFFSDENNINSLISGAEEDPYPIKNQSLIEQMEIIKNFDSSTYLNKIKIPSLIIGCDNDIIFPTDCMKDLKSLIPCSQYHEIKQAAHSVHIEQPQLISKIIKDFLFLL